MHKPGSSKAESSMSNKYVRYSRDEERRHKSPKTCIPTGCEINLIYEMPMEKNKRMGRKAAFIEKLTKTFQTARHKTKF